MAVDPDRLARTFYDAAVELATHRGTLQERLADAYADHLLQVQVDDLPAEVQPVFREIEERMTSVEPDGDEDPFQAAAGRLSDDEARALIERVLALYGRLAELAGA